MSAAFIDRRVLLLGAMAALSGCAAAPRAPASRSSRATGAPPQGSALSYEDALMRETNAARARQGVGSLRWDPRLAQAAANHSRDMLRRGYFEHLSPEGTTPLQRVGGFEAGYSRIAENLWKGEGPVDWRPEPLSRMIVQMWIDSPGHRRNLFDPALTRAGLAVARREREGVATMVFGIGQNDAA